VRPAITIGFLCHLISCAIQYKLVQNSPKGAVLGQFGLNFSLAEGNVAMGFSECNRVLSFARSANVLEYPLSMSTLLSHSVSFFVLLQFFASLVSLSHTRIPSHLPPTCCVYVLIMSIHCLTLTARTVLTVRTALTVLTAHCTHCTHHYTYCTCSHPYKLAPLEYAASTE
jgi:hypothetical protein